MSRYRIQHHGAPRRVAAAIVDDGTDQYYLYDDGTAPPSPSFPPPPHRGHGGQIRQYKCTEPSASPLHQIQTNSSYSPPPTNSSYSPPPPAALGGIVLTEVTYGILSIIPSLVQIVIAKARQMVTRIEKETMEMKKTVETTIRDENELPQARQENNQDIDRDGDQANESNGNAQG